MNLILCYTPLQVLIAEKVMEKYPNEPFFGVMIYAVDNPKFAYYRQRLAAKCQHFFAMHQHTDRFNLLKEIIVLKTKFRNKTFDKVFVASINDIQIQFLLSTIHFKQFYTFDDGTANIVDSSVYYTDEPNTPIRRLLNTVLKNRYSVKKLKSLSQGHFTIYPHFKNIIAHTIPIELCPALGEKTDNPKTVNILLGQPVYLEKEKNIALAEKVIKQFQIDDYLPHPREQYRLDGVNYIDTPLIFEDYIAQHFPHQPCRIYTYFSSAVLNVNSPNVEVVALRIETDEPAYLACYDLFEKVGLTVIDIRA